MKQNKIRKLAVLFLLLSVMFGTIVLGSDTTKAINDEEIKEEELRNAYIENVVVEVEEDLLIPHLKSDTVVVEIDEEHFPDPVFRDWIKTFADANKDGKLNQSEINKTKSISVNSVNGEIANFTGIEYFTALTSITVTYSVATYIDLTKNVNLVTVTLANSSFEKIDFPANSKITTLRLSGNALKSLDVSMHPALRALDISTNQLTTIDVSKNTKLETLYFDQNYFTALDFRNNKKLIRAYHAVNNEVVLISAGMLDYIGCHAVASHTGNITIDLEGGLVKHPDGSQSIDLSTVMSQVLLDQITEDSSVYDPDTKVLSIPAGTGAISIAAKRGNHYTFYVDFDALTTYEVTYMVDGKVVSKENVTQNMGTTAPSDPIKAGYKFLGWYEDDKGTYLYDFNSKVTKNFILYAKWEKVPEAIIPPIEMPNPPAAKPEPPVQMPVEKPAEIPVEEKKVPLTRDSIIFSISSALFLISAVGFVTLSKKEEK